MDDPFTAVDDWLPPSLLSVQEDGEFPSDFISALEGYPGDKLPDPLSPTMSEDLAQIFDQPNRSTSAMRTAFSMNDLQSLALEAQPVWHRVASIKPSLESVPEGGPPPAHQDHLGVSLMPSAGMFQAAEFQPSLPVQGQPTSQAHLPQFHQDDNCYGSNRVPGMFPMPGYPCGQIPLPVGCVTGAPSTGLSSMVPSLKTVHPSVLPAAELPTTTPGYGLQGSPEHMMAENKPEPDTDSSGNSHQPKLQPSAAAMRKSHSALELGAWRKMATGDMDFVDPSGIVRETLQGLELCQQVGKLTPEERLQKILRYRAKRQVRNFNRTIKYQCRKSLADTRPRVRGRFARDNEPGSVMPHETKKAIREKTVKGKPLSWEEQQQDASSDPMVKEEPTAAQAGAVPLFAAPPSSVPLNGRTPAVEHHATALAHLYCQWSEVGGSKG